MIEKRYGDLLSVTEGFIVHGCNARGMMGSGVAAQIRKKYPKAYEGYNAYVRRSCNYNARQSLDDHHIDLLGKVISYFPNKELVIANAITQDSYGRDSNTVYADYDAIRESFKIINLHLKSRRNNDEYERVKKSVNFPLIGCGLANGDWDVVKDIIDKELDDNIEKVLWIYEP